MQPHDDPYLYNKWVLNGSTNWMHTIFTVSLPFLPKIVTKTNITVTDARRTVYLFPYVFIIASLAPPCECCKNCMAHQIKT